MSPTATPISDYPPGEVASHRGHLVVDAALSRLGRSGYPSLRRVSCEIHNGVLVLRGGVSSFFLKQIAQALLRDIAGPIGLDNQLNVMPSCAIGAAHDMQLATQ